MFSREAALYDEVLSRAKHWLRQSFLCRADGTAGWGHFRGEAEPTAWGGTLDAIRALTALGVWSPDYAPALTWLRLQQRADGGFGSREIHYSAAEATAWVVILLAERGMTASNDECAAQAVEYLRSCVSTFGSAGTTPDEIDQSRTMTVALVLWALSVQGDQEPVVDLMVAQLKSMRSVDGWGMALGAAPTAGHTALALHAICKAGARNLSEHRRWMLSDARHLASLQDSEGYWRNSHDEWFVRATPDVPYRCNHFATAWALLALSEYFDDRICRRAANKAARALLRTQTDRGAWQYEGYDTYEHVWCTAQAMIALAAWQKRRDPDSDEVPWRRRLRRVVSYASDRIVEAYHSMRERFLHLTVAGLVVVQVGQFLNDHLVPALERLNLEASGIWTNLLSSLIWAGLVFIASVAIRKSGR